MKCNSFLIFVIKDCLFRSNLQSLPACQVKQVVQGEKGGKVVFMVKKLGVKKDKFFYGYIVLAAVLLIVIIAHGAQYTFGIFFKLILTEFDWTKAVTSGATGCRGW